MFSVTLSEQQQKVLAKSLVLFLSRYKHISDSYIIEFFSENLWETLPEGWQKALRDLSPPQVADLLLHRDPRYRVYPSVWPLSLLALRATAHTLAFPRMSSAHQSKDTVKLDEFPSNSSQSSLLGHIFRKHVKPKKQHEIRKLGMLVKQLCDQTQCSSVVDVGSGQTGISHTALDPVPRHVVGWINPRDTWESFLQQLGEREKNSESYPATAGSCKKRQRVSMTSDKERELETELVCGSQHLCTGDCSLVAYVDENPARSALLQHEKESNDCVARSDTVMAEFHLQTGFGWDSSTHPEVCSSVKEPVCSDFVLTGLHACGDLSATLLRHFANCPHVQGITSVACCYMKITTEENPTPPGVIIPSLSENTNEVSQAEYGYPMSDWVRRLPGHELSYKAREGACHAIEDYLHRLRDESSLLKTHCYRAALESIIRAERPQLRRAGIQTIKKAHMLSFAEYARLGLTRVGLPADLTFDPVNVEGLLEQQGRVVVYFSLALLLAPVVETLVLLDRMLFLQERGFQSHLIPLFDPALSPRNFVLVAMKPKKDGEEVIQQNSSHQSSAITAQNPQNVQD
ncbi:protein RRNAD1 isoform X2 [Tachysurus fulvidraco]|uniref:protein RRNAD1 isoform X2 n=1 Tax=Tachysurus fulvidraco TaxID=1234273 RepID=UPI001FEE6D4E|nr:protein RRNAD1 isoform X2 [Tachysurus fulvidraco]